MFNFAENIEAITVSSVVEYFSSLNPKILIHFFYFCFINFKSLYKNVQKKKLAAVKQLFVSYFSTISSLQCDQLFCIQTTVLASDSLSI